MSGSDGDNVAAIHDRGGGCGTVEAGSAIGIRDLIISGGHVFVMGVTGWLNPEGWHGYLPPVSLVAFSAVLFTMLTKYAKRGPQ